MAKSLFLIVIFCYISITISYNFNDRVLFINNDDEQSEAILNNKIDFSLSSASVDRCIPVRAVRELGCILSAKNDLFKGILQPVCEQHQICYACGFAHSITAKQCNKLALMNMYDICSQNKSLTFSDCLKQRFSAITLLRQHVYRSFSTSPGLFFECHQQCVLEYLYLK